ncbi:tyrosine-protein phosphatase [Flavobacterium aquiphilum]|uniref:tyrosine-protein phosphatase n=1 Tax=Flavobacterium aquiphilum TaxID=3003261 RepID=UPI002480C9F1|nr:CpsB/CapC family capsule biosynthesis tyrosine phosphatase [Flavobacterium aquiphilum]
MKDILPKNYTDIHNHLLPAIDDGAKNTYETTCLIKRMREINICSAIATPHTFTTHWNNTPLSIKNAFDQATSIKKNHDFLKGYASEYMLDMNLINKLEKEPLLCLKENYILVELPLFFKPINLYDMLFELKIKNYKIIIAHPERYFYFHHNMSRYEELKEFNIFFQLNLLSINGYYGKKTQKIAEKLIENDMYDFTGTDIHNEKQILFLTKKPIVFAKKNKIGDLLIKNEIF